MRHRPTCLVRRVIRKSAMAYPRYIAEDPNHPGAEGAQVAPGGVPVWAIIGYWQVVNRSTGRVAEDYELPLEAVEAALEYYRHHKAAIDARLEANTQRVG